MADGQYVRGLSDLTRSMRTLPGKIQRNVLGSSLRAGMRVVRPVVRASARKASGLYARGLKIATRSRGGTVTAVLKATGPHAHLGPWLEWGTRAHDIVAKAASGWLSFLGIFAKRVSHPGARPFPHMRPGLDSQKSNMAIAVARDMRERLATKHGLDTGGITLEGDE